VCFKAFRQYSQWIPDSLPHGPIDHAGLAEPATSGAAPGDFHGNPVVNQFRKRDDLGSGYGYVSRLGQNCLINPLIVIISEQFQRFFRPVRTEAEKRKGCRHPGYGRGVSEGRALSAIFMFRLSNGIAYFQGNGLPIADDHDIEKVRNRFRVEARRPAGDDQRVFFPPFLRPERGFYKDPECLRCSYRKVHAED
jgi:hypothetical protein